MLKRRALTLDELCHSGKKGMKWGYNDGKRNGKRTAGEEDEKAPSFDTALSDFVHEYGKKRVDKDGVPRVEAYARNVEAYNKLYDEVDKLCQEAADAAAISDSATAKYNEVFEKAKSGKIGYDTVEYYRNVMNAAKNKSDKASLAYKSKKHELTDSLVKVDLSYGKMVTAPAYEYFNKKGAIPKEKNFNDLVLLDERKSRYASK